MKVALCLSGQARGIDKTWDYFYNNIICGIDCDVFVSFANDDSLDNFHKINYNFTEIELIKDPSLEYLYSIAKGDVEYIQHTGDMGKHCTNLAVLRQYYYINRVNNMKIEYEKKNGFLYDWVIRSRADLYIDYKINSKLNELDNNCIYIPLSNNGGGLNDFFAFGSSKNMDIYCDRIGEIKKIESPSWPFWNPHIELKYILDKNNIQVYLINMSVERERTWRSFDGICDSNCHKYYGKYGETVIEGRRKKAKI